MYQLLKENFLNTRFILFFFTFPGLFFLLDCFFPVIYLYDDPIEKFQNFYPNFYLPIYLIVKGYWLTLFFTNVYFGLKSDTKNTRKLIAFMFLILFSLVGYYYFRFYQFLIIYFFFQIIVLGIIKSEEIISALKSNYPSLKTSFFRFLDLLDSKSLKMLKFTWCLLVILACVYRITMVFYSDNLPENDAPIRLLLSQMWIDYFLPYGKWSVKIAPNANWLPLHFYMSGIIYKLSNSLLAIRIFHALIGVFSALWIWKISSLVFNRTVASINSLAYLIYPASIYIGVQVMSEPIFICLSLIAVYYFLLYAASNNKKHLFFMVLFINLASFIRFEAWVYPFVFWFIMLVVYKSNKWSHYLILLLAFISPVLFVLSIKEQGFGAFWWLTYSEFVVGFENSLYEDIWIGLKEYIDSMIPFSVIATILVAYFYRKNKNILALCLFGLIIFIPFLLKTFSLTLSFQLRYLIFYEVWFLFALSFGTWFLVKKRIKNQFVSTLLSASIVLSLSAFGGRTIIGFENMRYDKEYFEAINFVNQLDSCNIILDHHNTKAYAGSYEFIANTRLPLAFPYKEEFLSNFINLEAINRYVEENPNDKKLIRFLVTDYYKVNQNTDFERLDSVITNFNNIYLIIFSEGELNKHFNFSKENEEKNGVFYERVFYRKQYLIYKEISRE